MNADEILKEAEKRFNQLKKKYKIKTTFEELDKIYYLKDKLVERKTLPVDLLGFIRRVIMEFYTGFANHLHGILFPAQNLILMTESEAFNEQEKDEISKLLKKIMTLASKNNLLLVTRNKLEEAKFIDECVSKWKKEFKPQLEKILNKIYEKWKH